MQTTYHPFFGPAIRLVLQEVEVSSARHNGTSSDFLYVGYKHGLRQVDGFDGEGQFSVSRFTGGRGCRGG